MRRAEWRRRADDPKGLLGWWWRDASRHAPFPLISGIATALVVWGQVLGAVLLTAVSILVGTIQIVRGRDSLGPLLPDPAPQGQFRARVLYRRDGLTTGTDEMALVVVDGWLVAEGMRSHFALRPVDVGFSPRIVGDSYALWLTDGSWLAFRGLDERGRRIIKAWREFEKDPPGEPTFPPRFVHPQVFAKWTAWLVCGFVVGAIPNGTKPFLDIQQLAALPFFLVGGGLMFFSLRRIFRLTNLLIGAGTEAREGLSEGESMSVDVMGRRVTISGEARLSPRPPLQDEPLGEGESVAPR